MNSDHLWFCTRCRRPLRNDPSLKPPQHDTVTAAEVGHGSHTRLIIVHDGGCRGPVALSVREGTS